MGGGYKGGGGRVGDEGGGARGTPVRTYGIVEDARSHSTGFPKK